MNGARRRAALWLVFIVTRMAYFAAKGDTILKRGFEYENMANTYLQKGALLFTHFGHEFPSAMMSPGPTFLLIFLKKFFCRIHCFLTRALALDYRGNTRFWVSVEKECNSYNCGELVKFINIFQF